MADDGMKEVVDTISVATGVGALAGLLPAVAALFTIVWTYPIVTGKQQRLLL